MLNRIVLGTANFTLSYGVLNNGKMIDPDVVRNIFSYACTQGINVADTAMAYGDIFSVLDNTPFLSEIEFITKFSVLDDYAEIYSNLQSIRSRYSVSNFYGLLIHDPINLIEAESKKLVDFLHRVKIEGIVSKIGVSVYDLDDVKNFIDIIMPDLIQIPANPLNQKFICDDFISLIARNKIEVHARSLFLQGILLANELPEKLSPLKEILHRFNHIASCSTSRLGALLAWANSHTWIDKWVLGITSVNELKTIVKQFNEVKDLQFLDIFHELKHLDNPLIDPRNWSTS